MPKPQTATTAGYRKLLAEGLWLNGRMVEAGIAKVWRK